MEVSKSIFSIEILLGSSKTGDHRMVLYHQIAEAERYNVTKSSKSEMD